MIIHWLWNAYVDYFIPKCKTIKKELVFGNKSSHSDKRIKLHNAIICKSDKIPNFLIKAKTFNENFHEELKLVMWNINDYTYMCEKLDKYSSTTIISIIIIIYYLGYIVVIIIKIIVIIVIFFLI